MNQETKIYVAGHRGLVGSSLLRSLENQGYNNLLTRTHAELDLINQSAVHDFFQKEKPDHVILAAAKVGGIFGNNRYPAEFIRENLAIQANVIHEAWLAGVKNLLFLGSSCIYPKECPQPIKEEYLLTGPLEPTNRPYALAKIAGIEMCWSYNRQYGTRYIAAMPTNLYGPGDNYDLETSHVIPALIRKFHEAKISKTEEAVVWGTGRPFREFLYSDDLADGCVFLMNLSGDRYASLFSDSLPPLVNIGCGQDLRIRDLVSLVIKTTGFQGKVIWDTSKPDGTPRKLLDTSLLRDLGWQPNISLQDGLKKAYDDYLSLHI